MVKIVGKCKCGCVLAVMSEAEERMLTQFAAEIVGTPAAAVAPTAPVEVAAKEKGVRPRKAAKGPAKTGKTASCEECGKPFVRRTSEKTCSEECRNKRNNAAKAKYQRKPAARPAVAAVPSAATALPHKCQDCGDDLDNPKKLVCNVCASLRLRDASRA